MGCSAAHTAKIHLGVDPTTSLVVAGVVTSSQKHDSQVLGEVLDLAQPPPGNVVIGDGAYDRRLCYAAAKRHRVTLFSPPGKRAVLHPGEDWRARNRSIEDGAVPRAPGLESRRRLQPTLPRQSPPCTGSKPLSVSASALAWNTIRRTKRCCVLNS